MSFYLDLKLEPEAIPESQEPPAFWPTKEAKIEVDNLTCAYAPQLPPVLKNVSFTVQPGERIGICGRTGSGKSSECQGAKHDVDVELTSSRAALALSLFRFIEASSGRISIDGIDISKITLTALRERLTILPQEAQLFSGVSGILDALVRRELTTLSRNHFRWLSVQSVRGERLSLHLLIILKPISFEIQKISIPLATTMMMLFGKLFVGVVSRRD
jgi:ABC-type transport system involved in Fe-S cluster assembly fused permease/ATPase subunit